MNDAPLVPPTPELIEGWGEPPPIDERFFHGYSLEELNAALDQRKYWLWLREFMRMSWLPCVVFLVSAPVMIVTHTGVMFPCTLAIFVPGIIVYLYNLSVLLARDTHPRVYLVNAVLFLASGAYYLLIASGGAIPSIAKIQAGVPLGWLFFAGICVIAGIRLVQRYRRLRHVPPYRPSSYLARALDHMLTLIRDADLGADARLIQYSEVWRLYTFGDIVLWTYGISTARFYRRDEVTVTPTGHSLHPRALTVLITLGSTQPQRQLMYGLCYVRYLHWKGEALP